MAPIAHIISALGCGVLTFDGLWVLLLLYLEKSGIMSRKLIFPVMNAMEGQRILTCEHLLEPRIPLYLGPGFCFKKQRQNNARLPLSCDPW